eukprot:TRINITY_DN40386_c0_g1_i1.p2 TRINITY_DN40386_c0_g1~~TRINITY_DN40386_c0_g1_i1.p2  ORF type:complete len:116 (+),score=24.17 TRINITY_DN40386_c0_g1_i1:247-594(+)
MASMMSLGTTPVPLQMPVNGGATTIARKRMRGRSMPCATKRTSSSAATSEKKKGFLEWLSEQLQKESLLETDPVLNKVNSSSSSSSSAKKAFPNDKKSNGGLFAGLFGNNNEDDS